MITSRASDIISFYSIRAMGGATSPAIGGTMEVGSKCDVLEGWSGDQELELVYDPQLNCYFDPVTQKYYELVQ